MTTPFRWLANILRTIIACDSCPVLICGTWTSTLKYGTYLQNVRPALGRLRFYVTVRKFAFGSMHNLFHRVKHVFEEHFHPHKVELIRQFDRSALALTT